MPMSHRCKNVIDLLVDYLEGDLPKEEAAHLDEHFEKCPPCLNFLETYKSTGQICRKAIEKAISQPMEEALLAHLRNHCKGDVKKP